MNSFIAITKALSDSNRVRALLALRKGELCVCQIIELLALAPSTVSKHMSLLKHAGLVCSRKDERWIYYRLPATPDKTGIVRRALDLVFVSLGRDRQVVDDRDRLADILRMDPEILCRNRRRDIGIKGDWEKMTSIGDRCREPGPSGPLCGCGDVIHAAPKRIPPALTFADRWGALACRISNRFRMRYTVDPGLHVIGSPDENAPVFVSANYRLSFNHLRKAINGIDAWVLVLDTKGINVWCAAGKGVFGTDEVIKRIRETGLVEVVKRRTIILPQLGAPGVAAHEVTKATGFSVRYGPVLARDLPEYLATGNNATHSMRTITFSLRDRLILTPMETIPAFKKFLWVIFGCTVIMGIQPTGILYKAALAHSWPIIAAGFLALIAGTFITPVLLPIIPFRSFAAKGAITGAIVLSPLFFLIGRFFLGSTLLVSATVMFFVAMSSYLALNFTGCTPFTNISGVKKEMRFAVPAYLITCGISGLLLVFYKLHEWRVL